MKTLKIPIANDSNIVKQCQGERSPHFDKPDLIKDYFKSNSVCKDSDEPCSNNSFLNKMDEEILKAKNNLDRIHTRR